MQSNQWVRKKFIKILFIVSLLFSFLSTAFLNQAGAEVIKVTTTVEETPGFYWCQHSDGHWSTRSTKGVVYEAEDDGGEPAYTRSSTQVDFGLPSSGATWKDEDGNVVKDLSTLSNPAKTQVEMGDDADPMLQGTPRIENDEVIIDGYSGKGVNDKLVGLNDCGGQKGIIYPFPIKVTFEAFVVKQEEKTCTLDVQPSDITLDVGESRNLEAYVTWSDGSGSNVPVATRSETSWSSTSSSKVSVSGGKVEGLASTGGSPVWVQATFSKDGAFCSANASVTVVNNTPPAGYPVEVEIRPSEQHIKKGDIAKYRAYLIYSNGGEEDVTENQAGQWSIGPNTVAGFHGNNGGKGHMEGRDYGTATVKYEISPEPMVHLSDTAKLYVEENPTETGPPEPPEPPEEENEPPRARWDGPSYGMPGDTIYITNNSYDPDGTITDVDWDIDPSSGVDDDLNDYGGTITFEEEGEYEITITVEDDDGDTDEYTDTIEIENKPPEAEIDAPSEVMQGDDLTIESDSEDPDGTIEVIEWTITPDEGALMSSEDELPTTLEGEENKVWFDKEGEYEITLTVTDNMGKSDTTTHTITVKPAIPTAYWAWTGFQKQNRAMYFDGTGSSSSARYPINVYDWEFIPPSGIPSSKVKIRNSSNYSKRDVMFKEAGSYTIRLKVTNTAGHTSPVYEQTVTILPDRHPTVDFMVDKQILRDPDNGSVAKITLVDSTVSPDADEITKRVWKYRYDSDNDGSFTDESWVTLDNGNKTNPVLYTSHVGNYQFELYAEESFGQPTLPEFIVMPDDLRYGDTAMKSMDDKTTEIINTPPFTSFGISKKYTADIVFALGQVDNSKVADFNSKVNSILIPKLAEKNIDANVTSVAAQAMDMQDTFAWVEYNNYYTDGAYSGYNGSESHIIIEGKNLKFFGYYSTGHKDWLFLPDNQAGKKKFDFYVDEAVTDWHTLEGAGYLFNAKIEGGKLQGYAILLAQSGIQLWEIGGVNVNQFHAGNWSSMSSVPGNVLLGTYPKEGSTHQIQIEVTQDKIDMWDNSVKVIESEPLPSVYGNGFGPMVSYSSHACSSLSQIEFKNIVMETVQGKDLSEIVKEPNWTTMNGRFIANITDINVPEFDDPTVKSIVLSRLLNDSVDYTTLGTTTNKSQSLNMVALNNNNGTWINNSNMNTALTTYANYIISKFNALPDNEQYILVGEDIEYETEYTDIENDPKYAERWRYSHNYKYFDNHMGIFNFHDIFVDEPIKSFDKVGRYDTVFQARDNPKNDNRFDNYRLWSDLSNTNAIYVHRRPIAAFSFTLSAINSSSYNLNITDQSYDLDHSISRADKGIVERKWRWKEASASSWTNGKPSVISNNKTYLLSLEVRDPEGVWSYPTVKMITTDMNLPPVAMFTVDPSTQPYNYSTGKSMPFTYDPSGSYDPNPGDTLTYSWRYQFNGGEWSAPLSSPPSTFNNIGQYRIELVVTDNHGEKSEAYRQNVVVLPNEPPIPGFTVDTPIYVGDEMKINSTAVDPDNEPTTLKYRYEITKPNGVTTTYQTGNPAVNQFGHVTLNTTDGDVGVWTIKQYVTDSIAPWQGPVTKQAIVLDVDVSGRVKHTDGWNQIHLELGHGVNPSVFYSGEKFILEAETSLEASKVDYVEVTMKGKTSNGVTKTIKRTLTPEGPTSKRYTGSIYEAWMSDPVTKLKSGEDVTFTFKAHYSNNIDRYDTETIQIIGHVLDGYNYHQSQ